MFCWSAKRFTRLIPAPPRLPPHRRTPPAEWPSGTDPSRKTFPAAATAHARPRRAVSASLLPPIRPSAPARGTGGPPIHSRAETNRPGRAAGVQITRRPIFKLIQPGRSSFFRQASRPEEPLARAGVGSLRVRPGCPGGSAGFPPRASQPPRGPPSASFPARSGWQGFPARAFRPGDSRRNSPRTAAPRTFRPADAAPAQRLHTLASRGKAPQGPTGRAAPVGAAKAPNNKSKTTCHRVQ